MASQWSGTVEREPIALCPRVLFETLRTTQFPRSIQCKDHPHSSFRSIPISAHKGVSDGTLALASAVKSTTAVPAVQPLGIRTWIQFASVSGTHVLGFSKTIVGSSSAIKNHGDCPLPSRTDYNIKHSLKWFFDGSLSSKESENMIQLRSIEPTWIRMLSLRSSLEHPVAKTEPQTVIERFNGITNTPIEPIGNALGQCPVCGIVLGV